MNVEFKSVLLVLNMVLDRDVGKEVSFDENLTQYGLDSINFVRFVVCIEEEFNVEIPDEYLLVSSMDNMDKIIQALKDIGVDVIIPDGLVSYEIHRYAGQE